MRCIALACPRRHDCADHDGDEAASEDEDEAYISEGRESAVGVHDDKGRHPCVDEVHNEDMPAFKGVVWVEQAPHTDDLVG